MLRAALPSKPNARALFPCRVADAPFLQAGLVSAQLAEAGKFWWGPRSPVRVDAGYARLGHGLEAF